MHEETVILLRDLRQRKAPRWVIKKAQKFAYSECENPPMSTSATPRQDLLTDLLSAKLFDLHQNALAGKYINPYY